MKILIILAAAATAAAGLWLGRAAPLVPTAGPPSAGDAPSVSRVGSAAFATWLPALREGAAVTFSDNRSGDPAAPATALMEVETLGPLAGGDLDAVIARMQRRAEKRYADLRQVPTVSAVGASFELLQQAEILCEAEESFAAAEALRRGQYFVTAAGRRVPGPPDAGLVQTSALQAGKLVQVSIVMPFADYPRFADAFAYRREMHLLHPASAVDHWNAQDVTWRKAAAARVAATTATSGSPADREWRRQYAPNGTVVDPDTLLMALQRGSPQ